MYQGIILLKGRNIGVEDWSHISYSNGKHYKVGEVKALGIIIHIAANSPEDYTNAFLKFSAIPKVTEVIPLLTYNNQNNGT
jgi:hypothetical protein